MPNLNLKKNVEHLFLFIIPYPIYLGKTFPHIFSERLRISAHCVPHSYWADKRIIFLVCSGAGKPSARAEP